MSSDAIEVEDPNGGKDEDHPQESPIEVDEEAPVNHRGYRLGFIEFIGFVEFIELIELL
jgi:hypothetical protein